eukprot:Gb_04248 [translate_table: standard]
MGDAILYTADDRNVHCVDEITDGERCTLTMWFTRDSSHNEDVKLINQLSDRLYLFYNNTDVGDYHSCSLVHRGKEIVSLDSNSKTGEDKFISEDVGNLNFSGYLPFSSDSIPLDWLPLPASSNMYWVNPETPIEEEAYDHFFDPEESASQNDSGFDIRWARISRLGFELCFDKSQNKLNEFETSMQTTNYYGTLNATDVLDGPLRLKWKGVELPVLFVNSLQVVQVVEFFQWKFLKESSHCAEKDYGHGSTVTTLREGSAGHQESQAEDENPSKKLLSKECNMANSENATFNLSHSVFSYEKQFQFSCEDFVHATRNWECYVCTLWRALLISLPQWKANEIIFPVSA